ncbi:MAG: 2Fe-2S iron-sulfur cluster-binding protein [Calditerrivibrio sp.]|uniref:2Fe-2S iron-sulfur cluster-binding protein n=1 Tax=Calditerrivibrio sp. TaxID=2792612 RepID=UPI003D0C9EFF
MPEIIINGNSYNFEEGDTILDIARRNNIQIPVMCYLEHITPTGACRLCLVEVEGYPKPMAACVTYAVDGMKVYTDTEEVKKHRNRMMEFILIKHPLDCPVCDKAGECMLQDTAYSFGIKEESVKSQKPNKPTFDWNMIIHDANLCVLCERCVKICHEITGNSALKIENRGFNNLIVPSKGDTLNCDFCGLCVDYCPVGALLDKPYKHSVRSWDLEKKESVCTMCPVGCSVEYDIKDDEVYRARSTKDSFICALGRYSYKHPDHPARISFPSVNDNGFKEISLKDVVENTVSKIKSSLNNYGSDSVAVLVGSRLSTEAIFAYKYLAEKIGCRIFSDVDFEENGYYEAYKEKFGTFDNYGVLDDIKSSELVFVIGSDLSTEALGIKWRVMNAVIHNNSRLVTIGLKKYEYDFFTDASILADYGDFAGVFEKIKKGDDDLSRDIASYITKAKKVAIIVGNEYIQSESQLNAVFSFADFIGIDKINCFINVSDKTNITAIFKAGLGVDRERLRKFLTDLEDGKVKYIITAGFYPYNTTGNYKRFLKYAGKAEIAAIDIYENSFTKVAKYFIPIATSLEVVNSYITIDGRLIKTTPVLKRRGSSFTDIEVVSLFSEHFGEKLPVDSGEFFDRYISGKNGIPYVKYSDIDGCMGIDTKYNISYTNYSYMKAPKGTKEVYVNSKYHNGVMSTFAAVKCEDEQCKRDYYFEPSYTIISGPDACFNGSCSINSDIAKGIVLIPKNR